MRALRGLAVSVPLTVPQQKLGDLYPKSDVFVREPNTRGGRVTGFVQTPHPLIRC